MKEKIIKILKNNYLFALIWFFFCIYYAYRLYEITPWYDEVYTYINFIDKGVIYSATHWPLPNNHVFFSVISVPFRALGIYIGLRGVSFLASMGTILLLYIFLKSLFSKGIATCGVMIYGMFLSTNSLAVQGRGYSLATFFLMCSLYCGYQISCLREKRRHYILFAVSLYLGLYTLMSSVYWVVSVCICFGVLLLLLKKYRQLLRLFMSAVAAAIFTVGSYSVLWFSMGAQSIQNELSLSDSLVKIVFEYPRTCLKRGIEIMRSDGNLQSIDRSAFVHDFKYFFRDILASFLGHGNNSMLVVFSAVIILVFGMGLFHIIFLKKTSMKLNECKELLAYIISSVGFLVIYLVLFIQSVYPFARVFSFAGIYLVILNCVILNWAVKLVGILLRKKEIYKRLQLVNILIFIFFIFKMTDSVHNQEYMSWDYYAYDAIKSVEWEEISTYAVSDIYANQQIVFHCNLGEKNVYVEYDIRVPDIVIMSKEVTIGQWPCMITDEDMQSFAIEDRTLVYENDGYYVYR